MRILRLVIECVTPLHCGGGVDDFMDQPVSRDAFGYWRIPGTSLAGSLRALGEKIDPAMTDKMFGEQEGSDSHASLVWCEDGLLLDYDGKPVLERMLAGEQPEITQGPFIRDHVRIDMNTGACEEGGKFDCEFVPTGTRFLLEFRCDGWDRPLTAEELAFFDELAGEVLAGSLSPGGKDSLGYGQYRVVTHEYRDFSLETPEGMAAWLALPDFDLAKLGNPVSPGKPTQGKEDGLNGWLELPLACVGPILIGGGASSTSEADIIFALTPRLAYDAPNHVRHEAVLPASSLRGIFRHAVYNILRDLGAAEPAKILDGMFGFVNGDEGSCGKIVVTDCPLMAGANHFQFVQHVALDRFSGGALEGALFSEEPFWSRDTTAVARLGVRKLEAHEAALFCHALFDLLEGSLAVGSGVNRGNGRLALPGWKQSPASAMALIKGDMSWNGQPVFTGNLDILTTLAPQWDNALKAAIL